MKYYIAFAFSLAISITAFSQQPNTNTGNSYLTKHSITSNINNPNVVMFGDKKAIPVNLNGSATIKYNSLINNLSNPLTNFGQPIVVSSGSVQANQVSPSSGNGGLGNNPGVTFTNNGPITNTQTDPRNLPLSADGKLLSVDGYEVDFILPISSKNSTICSAPIPTMLNADKNAACGYIVGRDNPASRDAANTAVTKYFQLRWLVFTDGGPSTNIDQTRINDLMTELNVDYAAYNMIFCADPATFLESAAWYTHNSNTDEFPMKDANNVNPTQFINIYVVGSMTAGGYARMPYDPNGGPAARGGIVLNRGNSSVGTHTLAHEMGHTFGLFHTFNGVAEQGGAGSCNNCYERVRNVNGSSNTTGVPTPLGGPYTDEGDREGDWCSDTNPHDQDSYLCPGPAGATGACDVSGRVPANFPIDNHMSYSFCTTTFTAQQSRRMHGMVEDYLTSWTAYGGGICGAQPPVADFVGAPTVWIAPNNVTFTDLSTPATIITGYTWVFDIGASGTVTCAGCVGANATFVGQVPPVVTYPNVGLYDVSLTVTSANGPDTETKIGYIEVVASASDCDTLDTDWNTPAPNPIFYSGVTGNFTGVPNEGSTAPIDPAGFYQQYFTPNPGTSVVGAATVGLGLLTDPDDDMTFQVVIYEDDAGNPGFPDFVAGPVAIRAFSPTALNVPTGLSYQVYDIPFICAPTITGATFHVGVEIFPGDATDELVVVSNTDGEGGSPLTNTYSSTACGDGDFNDPGNIYCASYLPVDFDLLCYPQMGWYQPFPQATGFFEDVRCDTTDVAIGTATLYDGAGCVAPSGPNPGMVGWTYIFADGTTINSPVEIPILNRTYTTAGPDTLTIIASNDCGRADTTSWFIPYNFLPTPDAEFIKLQVDPICMGAPGVDFNANTSGYQDYTWDFGDGTTLSSGSSSTTNYVYTAPGLYYTSLTVTSTGYQPIDTFYLEDFNAGMPGTYSLFDGDGQADNYGFGSWVGIDVDGDGDGEAASSSWWNPAAPNPADDWLITPAIGVLPANQMLSWSGEATDASFPDGYEVRISTTGPLPANVGNYNTVLFSIGAENPFETTRAVSLAAYAGQTVYIAFRNNSNDMNIIAIDDIRIGTTGPGCTATINKTDFVEIVDCSVIPPVAVLNASDSTGCAPLTVLFTDATVVGDPATTWLWNFGDATVSTLQNPPAHLYATPGTYFVSFQACNAGGCSTDFISIVVGTGTTSLAGPDQDICGGTTATLAGNDPTPDAGIWTLLTGSGVPTTPALFNSGVTGLAIGLNQFVWTITGTGCVSMDTVDITIALPVNAGTDNTVGICLTAPTSDLFLLLGVADVGGTWTPAMASGTGVFNPAVDPAGTYQYVMTGTAPCSNDTADVIVTITANDDPTFTYPDFCAGLGGAAGVINTPGGTFSFNPDPADGSTIVPGTGVISNGVGGSVYNVQYLTPTGPCQDSVTIAVNVGALANAGTDNTLLACASSPTIDLFTLIGGADIGGVWVPAMTSGTGVFDPATDPAGTYQYIVTGTAPCANDTSDVIVTITANDDPTFTYLDFCAGSGGVAGVINTPGGTFSFNPDPADGSTIVSGTGVISNGVGGSVYNIQYLTPAGPCQDSLTITVNVLLPANAGTDNALGICATGVPIDLYTILGVADLGGLWIPAMASGTGVFNPAVDPAGTYQYVVTGTTPCSNDTADVVVTFTANDDATFIYPDFCVGSGGLVGVVNTLGGTFSFNPDPADGSTIIPGTGAISNGVGGSVYNIQYLTPAGPCQDSLTIAVNVGTPVNAGSDSLLSVCSSAGATDLFTLIGGADLGGTWVPAMASGTGVFNPAVDVSATYQYVVTGVAPCGNDTSDVVVTVTATDDPTFTYPDFCTGAGGVVGVINTPGGTFSFNPDPADGSTIVPGTGAISNGVGGSVYNIQYVTSGVCPDSLTIAVNVNPCIVVTADFTTSSNTICAGDSIVFTDNSTPGMVIWQWDFDSTAVGGVLPSTAINQGPHTVFYNNPGTFVVELIVTDGIAFDTTSATIIVTDCTPIANFSSSQTNLCENDCITFNDLSTGGTPASWVWSFPGGTPANATGANPGSICYVTSGSYDVTLKITNQYGVDSLVTTNMITVGPCLPPVAVIIMDDADSAICVDNCIDFNYDLTTGGIPDTLDWAFEGGTPSSYSSNDPSEVITVCWNDTTNIFNVSVSVSNAYGNSNASVPIEVHVKPSVSAGEDNTITIGTNGSLNAVATDTAGNIISGGSYAWSPSTDLNCVVCQNATVIQPLTTDIYTVTYEDQYGCIVTDSKIINVDIQLNVGVPSGFSPNGDGNNDLLLVRGKIVIDKMEFTIYNKYGQKVFETTDIDQGWDGRHNGEDLNPGVFVYYVNVTFIDGTEDLLKGDVTLVR
jgi:gliding motility-associated-like protein